MHNRALYAAVFGFVLAFAPTAFAQQGSMPGMNMPAEHMGNMNMTGNNSGTMDMQAMMSRCAHLRQQAKSGARPKPGMQQMMAECDQMDTMSGSDTKQPTR